MKVGSAISQTAKGQQMSEMNNTTSGPGLGTSHLPAGDGSGASGSDDQPAKIVTMIAADVPSLNQGTVVYGYDSQSHSPLVVRTPSDTLGAEILTDRKTESYTPTAMNANPGIRAYDDVPRFTWFQAERMRRDPQVQFGLRILRAPLYSVQFNVSANDPRVKKFVEDQLKKIWKPSLRKFLKIFEYGISAGELSYTRKRGLFEFARYDDVYPRDALPLEATNKRGRKRFIGIRVNGGSLLGGTNGQASSAFDLYKPHAFWFAGEAEYGQYWSMPRMEGAHIPWLEKRSRSGAVPTRQLYFRKCAFSGGVIRYPVGQTKQLIPGTDQFVIKDNHDIAREIAEKYETGATVHLPSTKDQQGNYLWQWEAGGNRGSEIRSILEYPKELDSEILTGLGVVPEVVRAADTGSGWSGRSIPADAFFSSCDEVAMLTLHEVKTQILRFLVRLNFGKNADFDVEAVSLTSKLGGDSMLAGNAIRQGMIEEHNQRIGFTSDDRRLDRAPRGDDARDGGGLGGKSVASDEKKVPVSMSFGGKLSGIKLGMGRKANATATTTTTATSEGGKS